MKKDDVLNYIEQLETENEKLNAFVKTYEALSSFLTDYEFLKDSKGLTQKDIACAMGTTQSAVSRIESLKTNPSYKQLLKMTSAVGGDFFITPMGSMTVLVPYDLQGKVKEIATKTKTKENEYLLKLIRNGIESDYTSHTVKIFSANTGNVINEDVSKLEYKSSSETNCSENSSLDDGNNLAA
ncbi:MAG: helix-turn-helix transcriptional regulator [Treponema sp.]|nr:helix-turn-helix transcriptional regulator [Treponema sp.]